MNASIISHHLFRFSFIVLALAIPFSIAGANTAIGFGTLAWIIAIIASPEERRLLGAMKKDPIFLAALFLTASALISLFMSENISRAYKDWREYYLFIIYFLVGYHLADERFRKIIFWTLFTSITLSALIALVQHFGGLDLLLFEIKAKPRGRSTLYVTTFAGILSQIILLNISALLHSKKFSKRMCILIAGIIVQTSALLFNMTRGGWIALFFGFLTMLVLLRSKKVMVFGAACLLAVTLAMIFLPSLNWRVKLTIDNLKNPVEKSMHSRYTLWSISWDIIKDHPVLGVGMGDYTIETEKRLKKIRAESARVDRTFSTIRDPVTGDSHNIYLQILATRGIVGLIPFILFWIILLRSLFRMEKEVRDQPHNRGIVIAAISVTVAILFGAITENNIDDSEVFISLLFIIGLAKSTLLRQSD